MGATSPPKDNFKKGELRHVDLWKGAELVDNRLGDSPPVVYEIDGLLPSHGRMTGSFIRYTIDPARRDLVALRMVAFLRRVVAAADQSYWPRASVWDGRVENLDRFIVSDLHVVCGDAKSHS